jgi:multiple sugar transport system permease protein
VFFVPMLWMLSASVDAQASWSVELPHLTAANFEAALGSANLRSLLNSLVLSTIATVVATGATTPAAYALSRRRIPLKRPLLLAVLFLSGVPLSILIIPVYEMFASLGLLSIVPTAVFLGVTAMPFEMWLIKNFIDGIPYELEEAARIEDAGTWHILSRVVGPLAAPGVGAGAIYAFVTAWGSFLAPLVLISPADQEPGAVNIYDLIGAAIVRYGEIAAFSIIFAVPVLVLYSTMSRLFAGGFTMAGALKG